MLTEAMKAPGVIYIVILLSALFVLSGCAGDACDSRFDDIERRIDTDPATALRYVDSLKADIVWKEGMNAAERARLDLLRVKSADKAYVRHESDSLIRSVLEYYEKHPRSEQYPEALYYGGRVYSDLGDSPTALRYFQQALDVIDKSNINADSKLLTKVLSQIARLLTSRRLYKEAMPYIDKAIEIETQRKDSIGLMYDIEFSGAIRMHAGYYEEADQLFRKSMAMAVTRDTSFVIQNKMQIAAIRYYRKDNDSALMLIRELTDIKDTVLRRTVLTYASDIYLRAGIADTALMYAKELISSPNNNERKHGYQVILDPSLSSYISKDFSLDYINAYRGLVENSWDQSEDKEFNLQNSQFNYKIHEQRHKAAEKSVHYMSIWLIVACLFLFLSVLLFIWMRIRSIRQRSELMKAKEDIEALHTSLADLHKGLDCISEYSRHIEETRNSETDKTATNRVLRAELRDRLYVLSKTLKTAYRVPSEILESDAYMKLCDYLKIGKIIQDSDELWDELKETVVKNNEKFLYHLNLLTGEDVRDTHLHVCLLIKCGITPKQMVALLGRSFGAISSRREQLCIRIFGQKMGNKVIDDIIRLM